jgi:hypothetical protein
MSKAMSNSTSLDEAEIADLHFAVASGMSMTIVTHQIHSLKIFFCKASHGLFHRLSETVAMTVFAVITDKPFKGNYEICSHGRILKFETCEFR